MNSTIYEDGKYCVQDTGTLYIGVKYTLGEILEEEEIPFKFRLVLERYILPEAHPEDTLETHLYYLDPKLFLTKIYRQLKARVRVNILKEDRGFYRGRPAETRISGNGGSGRGMFDDKSRPSGGPAYTTKTLTLEQFAAMPPAEKERRGVVIQELMLSKLALMVF